MLPQMLCINSPLTLQTAPLPLCGGKRQSLPSRTGWLSVCVCPEARMHEPKEDCWEPALGARDWPKGQQSLVVGDR